jgi:protein phosphatase
VLHRKPRDRRFIIMVAVGLVLLLIAGLAAGRGLIRNNYYVVAQGGSIYIMRGVQGSFLGIALQEPFKVACLNGDDESKIVDVGTSCRQLKVDDLKEADRANVDAGLAGGGLDQAIQTLSELVKTSLLPVCASPPQPEIPATVTPTPSPTPTMATALPPPPPELGNDCRVAA